jgi:hypothetical protein
VKILIGTHLPEIHDSIDLMLNSKLVHIQLDEIDPLRYPEAKGISYSMAEFQTTLLQGEDADSDSDDEVYTDLAFDLAGDDNICRLAIADKNFGLMTRHTRWRQGSTTHMGHMRSTVIALRPQ